MITAKAGKSELQLWSSPYELPMERFIKFQSINLQDIGIGSSIEDYDKHEETIDLFLYSGKYESAIKERENKRYNVYTILEKMNTKSISLACLVSSIDGNPCFDISDEGLKRTSERINKTGITAGDLFKIQEELKKNWNRN